MVTIEEIRDKKFERAMFGGYAVEEVDAFLDAISETVAATESENKDLRAKLTILADKVQEYRTIEDGIKDTLLAAQKMGITITEEAREKAARIMNDAQQTAARLSSETEAGIVETEARLHAAREKSRAYAEKLILLFESYVSDIKRQFEQDLALPHNANAEQADPPSPPAFASAAVEDVIMDARGADIPPAIEAVPPVEAAAKIDQIATDRQMEYADIIDIGAVRAGLGDEPAETVSDGYPEQDPAPQPEFVTIRQADAASVRDDAPPASFKWRGDDSMDIQMVEITLGGGDKQRERRPRRQDDEDISEPRPSRSGIDIDSLRFGKNYDDTDKKDKD